MVKGERKCCSEMKVCEDNAVNHRRPPIDSWDKKRDCTRQIDELVMVVRFEFQIRLGPRRHWARY